MTEARGRIRIGVGIGGDAAEEQLIQAQQMGCAGVVVASPKLPWSGGWSYDDLARLRERVEAHDLRLEAIQHTPLDQFDLIRLGLPDHEGALADYLQTIRNLGRAGIPTLAYNWRPNRLYRTGTIAGRGGAKVTAFDTAQATDLPLSHGREYGADELWATHEAFQRAAVPVAVEAGVTLALHPDDPPGVPLGGVARIMSDFAAFNRAAETAAAIAPTGWGLLFCVGCWAEIGGTAEVLRGIRHFAAQGRIAYVHFRDVQGTAECFNECFPGEGVVNVTAVMQTLVASSFAGLIIDDHAPMMIGDSGWAPKSRAYQTGYLQGLLRAVEDLAAATPA
jgi:mannonate dehydratase